MIEKLIIKNSNTKYQDMQTDNNSQQPAFQWEAPVLYTENWLQTLGGSNKSTTEDPVFHT
jgi:hypothetical protein